MENNFNMQQNNMQQPMGQPMYQQPMGQPMYQQPMGQPIYMKPRRRTGWIAGLIVAAIMLLTFIGYGVWYISGFGGELEGIWSGKDATEISFIQIDSEFGETTYGYSIYDELGDIEETGICVKDEEKDELKFMTEVWNDAAGCYEFQVVKTAKIKRLTDDKLIIKIGHKKYTYDRD